MHDFILVFCTGTKWLVKVGACFLEDVGSGYDNNLSIEWGEFMYLSTYTLTLIRTVLVEKPDGTGMHYLNGNSRYNVPRKNGSRGFSYDVRGYFSSHLKWKKAVLNDKLQLVPSWVFSFCCFRHFLLTRMTIVGNKKSFLFPFFAKMPAGTTKYKHCFFRKPN